MGRLGVRTVMTSHIWSRTILCGVRRERLDILACICVSFDTTPRFSPCVCYKMRYKCRLVSCPSPAKRHVFSILLYTRCSTESLADSIVATLIPRAIYPPFLYVCSPGGATFGWGVYALPGGNVEAKICGVAGVVDRCIRCSHVFVCSSVVLQSTVRLFCACERGWSR